MKLVARLLLVSVFVLMGVVLLSSYQSSVIELEGTRWEYYSNGEYNGYAIQFGEGGLITTTHPLDVTPNNDRWVQQGKKVKFWFNDHYSDYQGKVISSSLIRGKAVNVQKQKWNWELRRISGEEKDSPPDSLFQ